MPAAKGKIVEGGRVILPAAFRKSMGLSKGDTVLIELHGEEVRIRPARSALRRLQEKLRDYARKRIGRGRTYRRAPAGSGERVGDGLRS